VAIRTHDEHANLDAVARRFHYHHFLHPPRRAVRAAIQ
jgi:hypothetical protein